MENSEKKELLRNEIAMIKGQEAKRFFFKLLERYPDYFFYDCPASSTGKYHPEFVQKGDGTLIHTKLVARLTAEICRMYDLTEEETDAFIIAALAHDGWKQGYTKTNHTVREHPELAARAIYSCYIDNPGLLTNNQLDIIYQAARYHYGRWGSVSGNPLRVGAYFAIVHIADCIVSKLHEWTHGIVKLIEDNHIEEPQTRKSLDISRKPSSKKVRS